MMNGKIALVTGATSGMGKFIALEMARQGATVVIAARTPDKGRAAQAEIQAAAENSAVDYLVADLSSQRAIRAMAQEFRKRYTHLHVLVNNAGAHFMERRSSVDGFEMNFAVNHLATVLLTELLLETLRASAPARIVNVASNSMTHAIDWEDLQSEKSYKPLRAYGQAKLAVVMYSYDMARRLAGTGVTVNALHPGIVGTDIIDDVAPAPFRPFLRIIKSFLLTPQQGARTAIVLASSPQVEGITGQYYVQGRPKRSVAISYDQTLQKRVTEISKGLVGLQEAVRE
jgi:NAD(P)-dependent dehydrogenase (short-subunit alcohol dehydrogenase family)